MAVERKSYVCIHVFERTSPVLYVTRPGGDWCFLCGAEHPDQASSYKVVGMDHIVEADPTIADVLDLEMNEEAERPAVGALWSRTSF